MITVEQIEEIVSRMRATGSVSQGCEVKEAVHGLPKSLPETLSAFANTKGGLILLGISEKNGFHLAEGFDANRACSRLLTLGDVLTPPVRLEIERIPLEGGTVVAALVPELPERQKPCCITLRGLYDGSFIRTGDGDRHLSRYEIDRLLEGRSQPQYDIEPVERASVDDLDPKLLSAIVARARVMFPRVFAKLADEVILIQLGVLTRIGEELHPTLAGLLAAGVFPQQFFPRLQVVFAAYPGTTKAGDPKTGSRYLDSQELAGSIPDMLLDTMSLVRKHMNTGAVVENGLRRDIPDYPLAAVREAVANAMQHRDYSPEGRGTQVQVNLYSDRLEITNPGGLYGATTVESLGKAGISSTRNEYLSRLLTYVPFEDSYIVENKGTGFMTIEAELSAALMPPPVVRNSLTFFSLTFLKRRKTEQELSPRSWKQLDEAILAELQERSSLSVKEVSEMSGFSRATVSNHIARLVKEGRLEPTERARSPRQRYRLVTH